MENITKIEAPMEVSQKLDLTVNKDDLMEMLLDQQLTGLEFQRDQLQNKSKELQEKIDNINKEAKKTLDSKLMKFLPKELSTEEVPVLSYYDGESREVTYTFKTYKVSVFNCNTHQDKKYNTDSLYKEKRIVDQKVTDFNTEILKIEKSGKRIKAKMLREFLNNTKEGKNILKLMSTSQVKLLS